MAVVLVVDDEIGIARLLEDVLVDEGHVVLLASNGADALTVMNESPPSVVLTDFMMPVMDGVALLEAMGAHPELSRIPVVLMSSMPETMVAERTSRYVAFVRKPFNIFELVDLTQRLIDERQRNAG